MALGAASAALATAAVRRPPPSSWGKVRVITLDVTGTIMYHRDPIAETYCRCAEKVGSQPPPVEAMRTSFKAAFKSSLQRWPCFGHAAGLSSREWWLHTVRAAFSGAGAQYGDAEFARVFRSVYQHFGSLDGYKVFDDVRPFLEWASGRYCVGLVSNNVDRLVDNTIPLFGLHDHFKFYVISHEVGFEKPSREIFGKVCEEATAVLGEPVSPEEILHLGDNFAADYCGARAAGMAAALVSREGVAQYQTWLDAPDFEGKAEEEVHQVASLSDVRAALELLPPCAAA